MTSILDAAVRYVSKHRWSVIPLKPNSKEPLVNWLEFQKRFPTPEELQKWFHNTQNNIGIVTGQTSNLFVLDADTPTALANLNIASSISVVTKRGRHLYFTYSGEVNSASKIAEHIDGRGEGGFVVGPPSIVDGHRYRFLSNYVDPVRLCPFPRELLNAPTKPIIGGITNVKADNWLSTALEGIREGNRNATFTQIVGRLHRDGHTRDSIFSLLRLHADAVQFDLGELENVIKSVTRYENGQSKGNVQYGSSDKTEDIESFLQGEEKVEWLIPGIIAKGAFGILGGLPETWKTWLLMDMGLECARGGEWLGHKAKKCKVLFIDQERFKADIKLRIKKLLKGKRMKVEDIKDTFVAQSGTSTRLDIPESFEAFKRKLTEIKPDLLILDSFATFHICSENERMEIQKVLEKIKEIRTEFGCSIIFVDHENKGVLNPETRGDEPTAFSIVGSVGKPAATEVVLTARKASDNTVTLYHTKSSLSQKYPPITLQLLEENDGIRLVKLG